jgi:hypothetical protein
MKEGEGEREASGKEWKEERTTVERILEVRIEGGKEEIEY